MLYHAWLTYKLIYVWCENRYNMSYIIRQGAENGSPVLGVSINYRMAAFGFLDSEEVRVCSFTPM